MSTTTATPKDLAKRIKRPGPRAESPYQRRVRTEAAKPSVGTCGCGARATEVIDLGGKFVPYCYPCS
jgi:hypothetical protein